MARKKEFDPDKVLDQAMQTFWLKGYVATSIDDLCSAMGIKRGSLYDTFGDKRSLFLNSLDRYIRMRYQSAGLVEETGSAWQAIAAMFNSVIEEAISDPQSRGCFLVNTIAELASVDPEIAKIGEDQGQNFEQLFYDLLARAEENGDIAPYQDLHAKAQFLVNAFYGLRITSKINQDRESLESIVSSTLSVVG